MNHYYEAIPYYEIAYSYDTTNVESTYYLANAHCNAIRREERGIKLLEQGLKEMKPKTDILIKYYPLAELD